jgi:two-component system, chemotaxis family, CheB/CheR fusion protein
LIFYFVVRLGLPPVLQETAMTVAAGGKPKSTASSSGPADASKPERQSGADTTPAKRAWLDEAIELVGSPAVVLDQTHRVLTANSGFCEFCRVTRSSIIGREIRDVGADVLDVDAIKRAFGDFDAGKIQADDYRMRITMPMPGRLSLSATLWRLPIFEARTLLIIDGSGERTASNKAGRGKPSPSADQGPLSVETLQHDLRQPLQTLSLLQGILAVREEDPALRKHIDRVKFALAALAGILNVLQDIEHPGNSSAALRLVGFPIGHVLNRVHGEFDYHAEARGFSLSVVPSKAVVHSDERRLEQTIRALLLAATKMIRRGKILLGCRRYGEKLCVQIWIGGETISQQQQRILDEFHRDEGSRAGRGIAHSIVQPLSDALGLSVRVRSRAGPGLVFAVDVPTTPISQSIADGGQALLGALPDEFTVNGTVAVVADRPREQEALTLLLKAKGHQVVSISNDGQIRLEGSGGMQPEIIVTDFGRPFDPAGVRLIEEVRHPLGSHIPVLVIADEAWKSAHSHSIRDPVTYLIKPATAEEIAAQIAQTILSARHRLAAPRIKDRYATQQTTFIIDDDRVLGEAISALLTSRGEHVEVYSSGESFLENYTPSRRGCLVVDDKLPGVRGVELLEKLRAEGATLPAIMISGHGGIEAAVRAMRAGAVDYLEKPIFHERLLAAIDRALELDRGSADSLSRRQQLMARFAALTQRERQVLDLVIRGASSKSIARTLSISQRTVENHRAAIMRRMGVTSLSGLIRTVMQLNSPGES